MCTTHILKIYKEQKAHLYKKHIFIISVIENLHFRKKYVEKKQDRTKTEVK